MELTKEDLLLLASKLGNQTKCCYDCSQITKELQNKIIDILNNKYNFNILKNKVLNEMYEQKT